MQPNSLGKDEKENTRVEGKPEDFGITYIPWGVCEWLLNNGYYKAYIDCKKKAIKYSKQTDKRQTMIRRKNGR